MKALNIIETAYRATLEEQDDTIVWLNHAMRGAGAELDVLLKGNAVNYAVKSQQVSPLSFGARQQKHAPTLVQDLESLIDKDVKVYILDEDLSARGIGTDELIGGIEQVRRSQLPELFEHYDQVWHW